MHAVKEELAELLRRCDIEVRIPGLPVDLCIELPDAARQVIPEFLQLLGKDPDADPLHVPEDIGEGKLNGLIEVLHLLLPEAVLDLRCTLRKDPRRVLDKARDLLLLCLQLFSIGLFGKKGLLLREGVVLKVLDPDVPRRVVVL